MIERSVPGLPAVLAMRFLFLWVAWAFAVRFTRPKVGLDSTVLAGGPGGWTPRLDSPLQTLLLPPYPEKCPKIAMLQGKNPY